MSRTRLHRRSLLAAASGVLALGLLAGCGGTDPAAPAKTTAPAAADAGPTTSPSSTGLEALSAAEIVKQSREALASAGSLHLHGTFTADGQDFDMDTAMVRGKGGTGHISMSDSGRMEMTVIGKDVYISGDKVFYERTMGKDTASLMKGKYIKTLTTAKGVGDFSGFVDFDKMLDQVIPDADSLKVAAPTDIRGVSAMTLQAADGDKVWVAAEGEPYILRIGSGTDDSAFLDFLDYGKKVTLTPPPAGKIVDISKAG
ncbi:hypothetical protein [Planotetraspora mira]|nr:hypothetical protein [Planotetraspora mira]